MNDKSLTDDVVALVRYTGDGLPPGPWSMLLTGEALEDNQESFEFVPLSRAERAEAAREDIAAALAFAEERAERAEGQRTELEAALDKARRRAREAESALEKLKRERRTW